MVKYLVVLLALIGALSTDIYGCSFGAVTACEKYARASVVVVGTVNRVVTDDLKQRVSFRIERSFKKSVSGTIVLNQPRSTCDWDFAGYENKKMLLYLARNDDRSYRAIGTGYGGEWNRQHEDRYFLNGLPGSLKQTWLAGTIKLYRPEPFEFIAPVPKVEVRVSDGKKEFTGATDENGVYQFWELPKGNYKIVPNLPSDLAFEFDMPKGDVQSAIENDFSIRIGEERCGGADFVVNKRND